jgi:hypothetical protein
MASVLFFKVLWKGFNIIKLTQIQTGLKFNIAGLL